MQRIAILRSLVNEYRHDREFIVWLQQKLFGDQKLSLAVNEPCRVLYDRTASRRTEVAGSAGSVLDTEFFVATMPLETLELEPKGFTVVRWNYRAARSRTAFARRKIKPRTVKPPRAPHGIDAEIKIAFCVVTVLRRDIRPRARQKC